MKSVRLASTGRWVKGAREGLMGTREGLREAKNGVEMS